MAQPLQLQHDVDPKQEIIKDCAEMLASFQIRPYDVLLVMYQRELIAGEKRLRSGIFLPDNGVGTMREDTYQGKVGLVMKIGASAFTDEPDVKEPDTVAADGTVTVGKIIVGKHTWKGFRPKVHDWVAINVNDSMFGFDLPKMPWLPSGRKVRTIDENMVRMIITEPDVIW